MEPGKKLDKLIHTKVMGLKLNHFWALLRMESYPEYSTDPRLAEIVAAHVCSKYKKKHTVIKYKGRGVISRFDNHLYGGPNNNSSGYCKTLEHSICLAALRLVTS